MSCVAIIKKPAAITALDVDARKAKTIQSVTFNLYDTPAG